MAAFAMLTAACGAVHISLGGPAKSGTTTTGSASSADFRANVAFAHCMQTHGVPNFPDPVNPSQSFQISGHPNGSADTPAARAYDACKQLLPRSSAASTGSVTQAQLDQVLKIAQCMRAHGVPSLPDPTVVNGSLNFDVQPSLVQSSQFQSAVNACRSLLPKGVHLP
jgi:hypothetical protein